jgi:hypothetical protein
MADAATRVVAIQKEDWLLLIRQQEKKYPVRVVRHPVAVTAAETAVVTAAVVPSFDLFCWKTPRFAGRFDKTMHHLYT